MKRLIAALCLLAAPAALRAQACSSSPCSATPVATSLTVQSAVSFSAGNALSFGTVAGGTTASVDAQGTASSGGAAGAVILNANQAVTVTAAFSVLNSGATNLSVASPSCGWSTATTTSTTNTTTFACGTGYTTPAAGVSGLYVWLGGSVATAASTPAGTYTGTATVTGVYTAY